MPLAFTQEDFLVFRVNLEGFVIAFCSLMLHLYWSESESETSLATSLHNGLQPNFQAKSLSLAAKIKENFRFRFRSYINAALMTFLSCNGSTTAPSEIHQKHAFHCEYICSQLDINYTSVSKELLLIPSFLSIIKI